MFARSTKMGNAKASNCGTGKWYRLSRFFYKLIKSDFGEPIGYDKTIMSIEKQKHERISKISRLLIVFLTTTTVLTANSKSSDGIYLYLPTGTMQTFDLNTLEKITFSEHSINILLNSPNDEILSVSYETLITFNELNSVIAPFVFADIQLSMQHPFITIKSDNIIERINVYNLQGSHIFGETIKDFTAILSLENAVSGIYILCVSTQHETRKFKILK